MRGVFYQAFPGQVGEGYLNRKELTARQLELPGFLEGIG